MTEFIPLVNVVTATFMLAAFTGYLVSRRLIQKRWDTTTLVAWGLAVWITSYVWARQLGVPVSPNAVRPAFWFVYTGLGILALRATRELAAVAEAAKDLKGLVRDE